MPQSSKLNVQEFDQLECLTSRHHWIEQSHARPTFCNICCEILSGVKSRGLSCEVCKFKVHKRCANKTISNCKWTTLSTIGRDIIEDEDGNILMPHQWIEGNLPVNSKCVVCDKNCGSVLKFQDFRCLWCYGTAHDICKHLYARECPLGPARLSVVPPIALHSVQDEAWDVFRPQTMSPLLVFVNSKSGDNQGVKFLRRLKQLLNPAQVFDLIAGGPRLGLKLFRYFRLFRILICSGDGSVSWVLSEIDQLDMHKQCQIAVLPLGTGNDLARVLGWGSACDDDAYLPQLLERYEKATTKMLDRWSIMTFEKNESNNDAIDCKITFNNLNDYILKMSFYEHSFCEQLNELTDINKCYDFLDSVKDLCQMVKTFFSQVFQSSIMYGDTTFSDKCVSVENKLDCLLRELAFEEINESDTNNENEKRDNLIVKANRIRKAIRDFIESAGKVFDQNHFQNEINNANFVTSNSNISIYHSFESCINNDSKTQLDNNFDNTITSDLSLDNDNFKACEDFGDHLSHIDSTDSDPCLYSCRDQMSSTTEEHRGIGQPDILFEDDSECGQGQGHCLTMNDTPSQQSSTIFPNNQVSGKCTNVCVIIEPPSPIKDMCFNFNESSVDLLSTATNNSSNESLNNFDKDDDKVIKKRQTATRRVSCCSPLKTNDRNRLKTVVGSTTNGIGEKPHVGKTEKTLPIINPFIALPSWPNVKSDGGFIGQCLLANADTLCAAVSPLLDPDEALMEGFIERYVMNNYFGIGIDAKIALDFHQKREEHPSKCKSRAKNLMWYGVLGSKELIHKTHKNLEKKVQLECDGQRIPLPSLQGIVVLNIPSFMGGTRFWGKTKEDNIFIEPSFDDKILEVVAVFSSVQMAASRIINLEHHRIAQCQSLQINILGSEGVPIQVDGEAWIQPPGSIRIIHKNRMQMLCRDKAFESSLKSWKEKLKNNVGDKRQVHFESSPRFSIPRHSVTGNDRVLLGHLGERLRQQSFSEQGLYLPYQIPRLRALSTTTHIIMDNEEINLLYLFIERANSLIKYVKMLSIRYLLENDLYTLANKVSQCLELIHPGGKLLNGFKLRIEFTKLVKSVQILYEETCCLLHDKNSKLKIRNDFKQKLSIVLANTEHELKKCKFQESSRGSLAYLQIENQTKDEKRRRHSFWTKLNLLSSVSENEIQKDVCNWDTDEVVTWLDTLQLSEYKDNFIANDIRGQELLSLSRKDLKELGVDKIGHSKRILLAVKNL